MTDRQRRIFGWVAVAGLVVSAASVGFGRWANSPVMSSGAVQTQSAVEGATTEQRYIAYDGTYFTADLPAHFSIKTSKELPAGPIYAQMLLAAPSANPGGEVANQLAVTVGAMPAGGLRNVSAVTLRQKSAEYTQQTPAWLLPGAIAFTGRQSELEQSVFLAGDEYYAAIVLSGSPRNAAQFETILAQMTATWRWK